jgi:glutathione synthase/RimK-type ligase-like ATP-grasp enzyme
MAMDKFVNEKILCVLLDDDSKYFTWGGKLPFVKDVFNEAYSRFANIGKKSGVKVIFTKYTNYSRGHIDKYWYFDKEWVRVKENIKPDLFYDKFPVTKKGWALKKKLTKKDLLFNTFELELFCKDKVLQAKQFPKVSPKTFLVKTKKQLSQAMEKITTEKAILKPRFGHGGFGIKIYDKNKVILKEKFSTDYILQELLDTTGGVPELGIKGVHDIRSVIINGVIAYSYVRVPKTGLLANLHQGGKAINVTAPNKVVKIIKKIDKYMKVFGDRVYSADFFFSNGEYHLVELNSKPGFDACGKYGFAEEENKFFELFFKKILLKKMG